MHGFRAPLGAFIAAWGGIAMITSGRLITGGMPPTDLTSKLSSPPHTLLILGIRCVAVGILFLILAAMIAHRVIRLSQESAPSRRFNDSFLYVGGLIVSGQMFFLIEKTWDVELHSVAAYVAMGIALQPRSRCCRRLHATSGPRPPPQRFT